MRGRPAGITAAPIALMIALAGASCSLSSTIKASPSEYAAYRRVRLASDHAERLVWASSYLQQYPDGVFRAEVQQWFGPAQTRFMRWAWDDAERLGRFLARLPDSPYASIAAKRRATLLAHREAAERAEAQLLEQAERRQAQLDQAAAERRRFIERYKRWIRWAVEEAPFGQTELGSALEDLDRAEELSLECEADACHVRQLWGFQIPVEGKLETRGVTVQLRLVLDGAQGLRAVGISGARLLDRLGEAVSLRAVDPQDAQARAEAIAMALTVSRAALDEAGMGPSCEVAAVTPVVLHRQCAARSVQLVAAEMLVDDDWVWVTPESAPAALPP